MSAPLGFNLEMPDLPNQYWPMAEVGETAVYTFDATDTITINNVVDPVTAASIATRPSGAGELAPTSIIAIVMSGRTLINVTLSGGVASRNYIHQLILTTQSGQILPVIIGQVCDPVLAIPPVTPPPSPIFGTPVSWP